MKKFLNYAFAGAIALTGAVGLSSCSSSEVTADVNPNYDEKKGEVPVNFVFNVSTGNTASTRMSQENVQATATDPFRGMDETALMSFKLGNDNNHVAVPSTVINKLYGLGPILGYNDIGPDSKDKSRRVLELSVPVGTNAMMFYGKATKDLNSNDTQGKITMNLNGGLNDISFSLCPRIPEGESTAEYNQTTFGNYQQLLSTIINSVIQSKYYGSVSYGSGKEIAEEDAITWEAYGTIVSGTTKTLKEKKSTGSIAEGDGDPADPTKLICGLGEILSSAFVNFNKFYDSETTTDLRAGSGFAVQNMLGDLYTVVDAVANATPTNMEEAVAKALASKIITNLKKALHEGGASFLTIDEIKSNMELTTLGIPTGNDDLTQFPSVFGVPEGAAILKYDLPTNTYSYRASIPTYNMGGGSAFDLKNYMYPAELCYFGNSPIRHSSTDIEISAYPQGTTAWDNESSWKGWSTGHVESSTREVAMKYNINYGTSLLKTQVKYGAATIEDNNYNIQKARKGSNEPNQTFDVSTKTPFTLTGVIIGGQTPTIGWDFLPKSSSSATAMIYDRDVTGGQSAIPSYTSGGSKTSPVYTLVWDNWDAALSGAEQHTIYIALEFKNNSGKAFWGESNLIPDGGTFYITGKLEPDKRPSTMTDKTDEQYTADKSLGITWPTKYALPPYATDGKTIKQRRVFIQDFMTEATFVIGQKSLQKAMIAVPDLRASHLSVGLSVDLEWSTGLSFGDIELGK